MKKRKHKIDRRGQKVFYGVCILFLLGVFGGALAANILGATQRTELAAFLEAALVEREVPTFWRIFWKYLKYAILIWIGGWVSFGIFFSGAAFLFRSIAVGFTSATLLITYGGAGVWTAITAFFPQNLLLIPTYGFLMTAAMYYLLSRKEEGGKRGLKRERQRKRAEYCILFAGSVVLLFAAAGVEWAVVL